ncbi:MAG: hypothetical protein WC627_10945 [Legionella sp.]|jgi:hypothetical protein
MNNSKNNPDEIVAQLKLVADKYNTFLNEEDSSARQAGIAQIEQLNKQLEAVGGSPNYQHFCFFREDQTTQDTKSNSSSSLTK